ncbi:hypothetical protein BD626DRAFT_565649 [Schizophyllum amplum]|uniref:Uncharacterized protein n=1 Tax=Schizophyllum amplum TaxID=97359 RepID=A0A550CP15_9AGAR|nr:hypothetical protein BD626DRAFT_565649 [Auriculariopsis ampla]
MRDAAAAPEEAYTRQPKRMRKNHDLPEYEKAPNLGKNNPMNRRSLKKDAKRARKIQRLVAKAAGEIDVIAFT